MTEEEQNKIREDLERNKLCTCKKHNWSGKVVQIIRSADCPFHKHLAQPGK